MRSASVRRLVGGGAFGIVLILHTALLYHLFAGLFRNADNASHFLAGVEIGRGNLTLAGWWMSADNFITEDLLFYGIATRLFGVQPLLIYVLPALTWAALTLVAVVCVLRLPSRPGGIAGIVTVATLLGLPILTGNDGMNDISDAPIHLVTVLYGMACLLLADVACRPGNAPRVPALAALAVLVAMACFGDPMALFITSLPLLLVSLLFARAMPRPRAYVAVAGATAAASAAGRLALRLAEVAGGLSSLPIEFRFADFDRLGANVALAARSLLVHSGALVFGRTLGGGVLHGPWIELLRLPLALLLVYAVARAGVRAWPALATGARARQEPWAGAYLDTLLAASFVLTVASAVCSSTVVDIFSARYFLPALIYGAALLGRSWPDDGILRRYAWAAAAGSAAFTAVALAATPWVPAFIPPDQRALLSHIDALGLDEGYAYYWDSSILTVATRGRVVVRAITPERGRVVPYKWLSSRRWYETAAARRDGRFFVLVRLPPAPDRFTEAEATATFGPPLRQERFGNYVLDVFDRGGKPLDALRP